MDDKMKCKRFMLNWLVGIILGLVHVNGLLMPVCVVAVIDAAGCAVASGLSDCGVFYALLPANNGISMKF